jgi:iron complex transport system substrate-binding protein
MMWGAAGLTLLACSLARATPAPQRVMSLNACTDVLLLRLLPHERIASVTFLTHESRDASLRALAAGVGSNRGAAEEVLSVSPDLVLAGQYTTPAARMILARLKVPTLTVAPANNFASIRLITLQVAKALGEEARAQVMLGEMDATLDELARTAPARKLLVAAWDGGGSVPARNSLFDAILTAAGAVNVARSPSDAANQFDVEDLLVASPDLLLYGDSAADGPSLRDLQTQHPAIRRRYASRTIAYPEALYSCGEPGSAAAAVRLRTALVAAASSRPRARSAR